MAQTAEEFEEELTDTGEGDEDCGEDDDDGERAFAVAEALAHQAQQTMASLDDIQHTLNLHLGQHRAACIYYSNRYYSLMLPSIVISSFLSIMKTLIVTFFPV